MAEIHGLPYSGFAPSNKDIAEYLRDIANSIEEGDPVRNLYFTTEYLDGRVDTTVIGHPTDMARTVGVMTFANAKLILEQS
jgi:hypothetical protein